MMKFSQVRYQKYASCLCLFNDKLVLPKCVKVVSAEKYGKSDWSQTGRINATDANGTQTSYFLKARHLLPSHVYLSIIITCLSMLAMSMGSLNLKANTLECLNCTIMHHK